jgi:hypothetical protein
MKPRTVRIWLGLAALSLVGALTVASAPRAEAAGSVFQAGFFRLGGVICRCPVMTGDCVCELPPK